MTNHEDRPDQQGVADAADAQEDTASGGAPQPPDRKTDDQGRPIQRPASR